VNRDLLHDLKNDGCWAPIGASKEMVKVVLNGPSLRRTFFSPHTETSTFAALMNRSRLATAFAATLLLTSCADEEKAAEDAPEKKTEYVMDHHSHARPQEAVIKHLHLDINADLQQRVISGTAGYDIESSGNKIIFDTEDLVIERVTLDDGTEAKFALGDSSILGRPLIVDITPATKKVNIIYRTTSTSKALQWLSPQQTQGKTHPFLFTQGQAILTRTWIPIQDSPGIRLTYSARVKTDPSLMAVMSASNPTKKDPEGVYEFRMDQPIPAYLIALSIGDLDFRPIGARTGVYAEPAMVEKAANEFADMERMLEAAEKLYGPYRWERYDVIVLPPSFPFGGMENPRLTFATPTIIAGDRSLTSLIAHELAHSWSGNLVTNATWDDFWLNEGFTVYFENRIFEQIFGKEQAEMNRMLGHQDLLETLDEINKGKHPADSHLRLKLEGRDPDEGMTDIAYEKGHAFLRVLEEKVGRGKFDAFLRKYFDEHAFQSMTTDRFLTYLDENLLKPNKVEMNIREWVDGPGLPANVIVPQSDAFVKVETEIEKWNKGSAAAQLNTEGWNTFQWMHFLRHLPQQIDEKRMIELDKAFNFSESGNSEVLAAWLEVVVRNDHDPSFDALERFLTTVGRRKFLVPLYTEMIKTEKGKIMAQKIYQKARPNYHAVSVRTIDELLKWKAEPVNF
jgi:aminopeptidase N